MADNKFKLEDYTGEVKKELENAAIAWLYEAGGELHAQTVRNTAAGEGQLKGSWRLEVDRNEFEATVGSPLENAIWEEFGTGEHALEGKGRQTPWYVPVEGYTGKKRPSFNGKVIVVYGKNKKKFYKTNGKKPRRMLWNAFNQVEPKIIRLAKEKFKGID